MVLQPASDDTEDDRVVFTTAKNNDGEHGPRSAWRRTASGFQAVPAFDWEKFDGAAPAREPIVTEAHIQAVFEGGKKACTLASAAANLQVVAGCGRSTAYEAMKAKGGRFTHLLKYDGPLISLKTAAGVAIASKPLSPDKAPRRR